MEQSGDKWGISMFMGEYHYNIDEKNRLTIPSKIRDGLGEAFILTRGLDNSLAIYAYQEWENIISKYKELPNTKDARNFMRFFLSGAITCELDKQGRITITDSLIKYADIKKECVIIGVNDHLEIWSSTHWNKFIEENECRLSDIADELFSPNLGG